MRGDLNIHGRNTVQAQKLALTQVTRIQVGVAHAVTLQQAGMAGTAGPPADFSVTLAGEDIRQLATCRPGDESEASRSL